MIHLNTLITKATEHSMAVELKSDTEMTIIIIRDRVSGNTCTYMSCYSVDKLIMPTTYMDIHKKNVYFDVEELPRSQRLKQFLDTVNGRGALDELNTLSRTDISR